MALPSAIFFAICLVVLSAIVLLLQRRYLPLRTTPEYLLVSIFLPLFISSSIVVLVPIDLASASSSADSSRGIVLSDRVLLVFWRIAYWLCFVLTWAILPLLQSYSDSGHRSPQRKVLQSLRENLRYHLIVLSIGLAGLVYFFLVAGVHIISLKALVIALSHCYALTLAIYLMGHGLVAIPRSLFQDASISGKLRRLQRRAPRVHDKLIDATSNLESIEAEVLAVRARKQSAALEFQDWIDELMELLQLPEAATSGRSSASRVSVPPTITEEHLATLTARLRLALHCRARFQSEWEHLVQSAAECQAILDSKSSQRLKFTHHFGSSPSGLSALTVLTPYTRHLLYLHVVPILRLLLSAILALASVSLVWSEVIHSFFPRAAVLQYTIIHHPSSSTGQIGFLGQLISALWLAYMCLSAYYTLTVVKVWGSYALTPRLTAASSACFYASYAARLTVPLAFNFVSLLPSTTTEKTVFYDFVGKLVNLTALGEGWNDFLPILVLIPVGAAAGNLYKKAGDWCGIGDSWVDDEEELDAGWREGRIVIERELSGGGSRVAPAAAGRYRDDEREDEQQEGFFSAWTHRFRNTLDTVETPRWFKDVVKQKQQQQRTGSPSGSRPAWRR